MDCALISLLTDVSRTTCGCVVSPCRDYASPQPRWSRRLSAEGAALKHSGPKDALHEPRQLGIRLKLDRTIVDLSVQEVRELLDLLARHGVLCIVDQPPIRPGQLRDFVSRWGEVIELPPGLSHANQEPGLSSITRVGNMRPDGSIIPNVHFGEYWHHDGDFWPPGKNFIVNFLSCARVPPVGGNTGFLDSRLAYQKLSDQQKTELAGAHICVRASDISDFKRASRSELPPDVEHPVVLAHPLTSELALYLPDSSTGIQKRNGQSLGSVQDLLTPLLRLLTPLEHAWEEGELLIIDNLQTMHRSMGGYGDHSRLLYRCQARIF